MTAAGNLFSKQTTFFFQEFWVKSLVYLFKSSLFQTISNIQRNQHQPLLINHLISWNISCFGVKFLLTFSGHLLPSLKCSEMTKQRFITIEQNLYNTSHYCTAVSARIIQSGLAIFSHP